MLVFFSSSFFAALFGTIAGAFIAYWLTKRNEKLKLTLEFHKEWNSYEMSTHRRHAYNCIKKFPDISYNDLNKFDEVGSISVYIVLRFYQRLWLCFDNNSLHKQITASLFYDDFYWYYFISFNTSLKVVHDDWSAYKDIEKLKVKIREYTSELDYQNYRKKYNKKYIDYVSQRRG